MTRNLRKVLAMLLACVMVVSMAACSGPAASAPAASAPAANNSAPADKAPESGEREIVIAQVGKLAGDSFNQTIGRGFAKAAETFSVPGEYKITTIETGPTALDAAEQVKVIESLIAQGVDAICCAANDSASITPVFEKAREAGIVCIDYDSRCEDEAVSWHVDQFTPESYAETMVELMVNGDGKREGMGDSGQWILMTGSLLAENLNSWCDATIAYAEANYPNLEMVAGPVGTDESVEDVNQKVGDLLRTYPDVKGIIAYSGSVGGATAYAIRQAGLSGQIVAPLCAMPIDSKQYLEDDSMTWGALFDVEKLGYFACWTALQEVLGNEITNGQMVEGLADPIEVQKTEDGKADVIVMGPPLVWDLETVDQYNF